MTDWTKLTLKIDDVVPDDLSMRRLAAYLAEFAKLLGEEEATRFDEVRTGSTRLVVRVRQVAVPKVRSRLTTARDDARSEAHRQFSRLDEMMADDNTSGAVIEDGHSGVVIRFPGAKDRGVQLPTITESGSIQGELIRIGGRDETAHALLQDGDRFYSCIVSRDIARALGKHLFGGPLRLHGRGRWRRTADGNWELQPDGFRATDFEVLDPRPLRDAAKALRSAGGFGFVGEDDAKLWNDLATTRGDA